MMYDQNRKSSPGNEVILRRFFREVQQNRLLSEVKKRRYRDRKLTRTQIKAVALRKARVKKMKRGY